jgi:hypothetical protein
MSEDLLPEILRESNFPGNIAAFEGLKEYMAQGDLLLLKAKESLRECFPPTVESDFANCEHNRWNHRSWRVAK